MRSLSTTRTVAGVVVTSSRWTSAVRVAGSVVTRWRSCRRSACFWWSIAPVGCTARNAASGRPRRCRPGSPDRCSGRRLRAAIVTLTARNRISRRGIAELADELFGARLSTGSVDAICQHTSAALADGHEALRDWVLAQDAVHVDETGWRTAGDPSALWTAATEGASIFEIAEHCNREQFDQLIGDYTGIVISDRWHGYSHLDPDRRQVCWSHIQRDFRRHSEGSGRAEDVRSARPRATGQVFGAWRAYQHEHHDRDQLTGADRADPGRATATARARRTQEPTHPLASTVRQQPAQDLASPMDLHQHRGCGADQQPRRTRAPWPGDPPKTLARHPIRYRRTIRRACSLSSRHLPPTTPLPVRIPDRTDHRPQPR